MNNNFQFLIYQSAEENVSVDALIKDETIWLTQKAMAELFDVNKSSISRHLKNIFSEGELNEKVVVAKIATTTVSSNSPVANIFFKCLLIPDLSIPKSSAMAFCVIHKSSSLM